MSLWEPDFQFEVLREFLPGQTWLICGGRDFADQAMFDSAMRDMLEMWGCPARVVHGAARGADRMAGEWADRMAIEVTSIPVTPTEWKKYGRAAGPRRNQRMLDQFQPHLVVAFPRANGEVGPGTADMMQRARNAKWKPAVIEVRPNTERTP